MPIKGIMFDLWDTLIYDAAGKKGGCFSEFARTMGCSNEDPNYINVVEGHLMKRIHRDLKVPVRRISNELDVDASEEVVEALAGILDNRNDGREAKPYPEAFGTLKRLKTSGYKLGLLTNTYWQSMAAVEKKYSIGRFFNASVKSYEVGWVKPDPRIFDEMLYRLGLRNNEVVMVGNSLRSDVRGAENCGIPGILVDRNNRHPNYARRVASLDEVQNFLR